MELELIESLIISAAPAITAVISIIVSVVNLLKQFKKVDGDVASLKTTCSTIIEENRTLKEELKQVYKMHSEIVNKIKYDKEV